MRFWLSGFSMMTFSAPRRADQARQQVGAAPAGQQAQEALGERDRGHARGDRPVRAVQRELEAAAERRAVHERERRHAQLAEPPEHRVPEPADGQRLVPRADQRGPGQVRADREDERLAGDADRGDTLFPGLRRGPGRHLLERVAQRDQPRRAERIRPRVVVPVVQRDERHRARPVGQFHVADESPGDHFTGKQRGDQGFVERPARSGPCLQALRFSHRTVPPMPIPTHIVVRP